MLKISAFLFHTNVDLHESPTTFHNIGSMALLVARRTNNQPTIGRLRVRGLLVCITVLTGDRMGVNCPLWPAATPSEL